MKIRTLLAGLLVVASTSSALAAGPYVGAAGGVSFVHDGDISAGGLTATAEYDTAFAFNVSAGYHFDPIRAEFEFGYKNPDMDKISGPGGSVSVPNTDLTVTSYMANVFYDFKLNSPLTPYVGAGIGFLNGELEVQGSSEDDTTFGYQLIAGAAFNVNKNLAIDLSYRFQSAPSDFSVSGVDVEYNSSNILAGVRYTF